MKRLLVSAISALFVLSSTSNALAQLIAAKDGPVVYGHHHLNASNIEAQKKFFGYEEFCKKLEADGIKLAVAYRKVPALNLAIAFITDPWGSYIELTEGLDKVN
jgi:hypothetical protein